MPQPSGARIASDPTAIALVNGLPRQTGTALHRQIFVVLRDEITRGIFTTGALPNEESLCERFGVSRITVRRALADLVGAGLVERRHGLGTFVRRKALGTRGGPSLGLLDELRRVTLETQVEVIGLTHSEPPHDIATLMRLKPGERAMHALRLRRVGKTPVVLTDAWVPDSLSKGVTKAALRKNALYEILIAQGVRFGRVAQEFTARVADPTRAAWLQTEVGAPLLTTVRLMHDHASRPILHLVAHMAGERSRILMDIPGESINSLDVGQFVHDLQQGG